MTTEISHTLDRDVEMIPLVTTELNLKIYYFYIKFGLTCYGYQL